MFKTLRDGEFLCYRAVLDSLMEWIMAIDRNNYEICVLAKRLKTHSQDYQLISAMIKVTIVPFFGGIVPELCL